MLVSVRKIKCQFISLAPLWSLRITTCGYFVQYYRHLIQRSVKTCHTIKVKIDRALQYLTYKNPRNVNFCVEFWGQSSSGTLHAQTKTVSGSTYYDYQFGEYPELPQYSPTWIVSSKSKIVEIIWNILQTKELSRWPKFSAKLRSFFKNIPLSVELKH